MDTTQLDRMASFGSDKVDVNTGQVELGLNRNEIQKFITVYSWCNITYTL